MAAVIPSVCAYDSDCRVVVDYVGVGVCSSGVVREALSSWLGPLCLSRVLTFFFGSRSCSEQVFDISLDVSFSFSI